MFVCGLIVCYGDLCDRVLWIRSVIKNISLLLGLVYTDALQFNFKAEQNYVNLRLRGTSFILCLHYGSLAMLERVSLVSPQFHFIPVASAKLISYSLICSTKYNKNMFEISKKKSFVVW